MEYSFRIENTFIELSLDLLQKNQWSIQSVPYNYVVKFCSDETLKDAIKTVAKKNGVKNFIYIDEEVYRLYSESLLQNMDYFTVTAIEENKSLDKVTLLLDYLQAKDITKKEIMLSAGGGITQDISAFARSVYKRGINWIYLPTTLLSMADSCIGAKSCLNYGGVKNQLGLFSSPKEVYIAESFLRTLSEKDVLSGYGEIIKLCIVGGKKSIAIFCEIANNQKGDLLEGIQTLLKLSLLVKKSVIEIDEYENDIRRALNYGHTIGHAIEPLVHYQIPHGIAVSIGMVAENLIAAYMGVLPNEEAVYLNSLIYPFIDKSSWKILQSVLVDDVMRNMRKDKKAMNADIYMSVPFGIGHFDMLRITPDDSFKSFLKELLKNLNKN